jgi:hypothetical protein
MRKVYIFTLLAVTGCASTSGVLPVGSGSYLITSESEFSVTEMHKNAVLEANKFCTDQKKTMEILKTETGDGGIGFAGGKKALSLTFRCN